MNQGANTESGRALTLWQQITYSCGEIGVGLSPGIVVGWLLYYYTKASDTSYLPMPLFTIAFIMVFGRIIDSVADPAIGYWSDKYTTRMGRRIPWVIFGTPLLFLTFVAMWFPPVSATSWWNFVWLLIFCGGFWFFFTAVVAPYLSLLPEITPYNDERIAVSMFMGYGDVIGMICATMVAGILIDGFSKGVTIGPIHLGDGYKVMSIIIGLAMIVMFYISVGWVRERPHSAEKEVPFNFFQAFKHCMNDVFIPYVVSMGFFRIAVDVLVAIIPFMVDAMMYKREDVAGILQAVIVVVAAFLFPLVMKLSKKHGKKKMFLIGLLIFAIVLPFIVVIQWVPQIFGIDIDADPAKAGMARLIFAIVAFLGVTFSVACSFVLQRAIIADIIDVDAERTGYRREAMYNGMEGLITKFAAAIATALVPLFLWAFGDGDVVGFLGKFYGLGPAWGILMVGPFSGFLLYLGYVYFKKYPIEK